MKSSKVISAQQWQAVHPPQLGSLPSDFAYARICTAFLKKINQLFKQCGVTSRENVEFALSLGCYVEDVVSNTHIFDSFRKIHSEMYGKKLPFYDVSADNLDDEVNIDDVKFLIWDHVQQMRGDDAIINPDNEAIDYIANELFPLICDAYEMAPEVVELHDFIFNPVNYADFIECKKILMWLSLSNPITTEPGLLDCIAEEVDSMCEEWDMPMNPVQAFYFVSSLYLFQTPCKWMSLFSYEILSQMLESEGMMLESGKLRAIRHTGTRDFKIQNQNEKIILLSDADGGEYFRVSVYSFADTVETDRKYITTDLVSFDGDIWEVNGSVWFTDKPAEKQATERDGKLATKHYLNALNGKRIGYFRDFKEMQNRIIGDIPFSVPDEIRNEFESSSPVMVFLNSNGSLNLSPTLASTIPDPDNPYFKGMDKSLLLASAVNERLTSAEMAQYFKEQGWYDGVGLSSSISPERGLELFHDNFDFLLRYFRGAEYRTSL